MLGERIPVNRLEPACNHVNARNWNRDGTAVIVRFLNLSVAVLELLMPKNDPRKMGETQGLNMSLQVLHRSSY